MPNRIIHEKATQSETLDRLGDFTERTFWRLTTKADDYGRFDADPIVMLSRCYERRLNGTKSARRMELARDEMATAGLITLYHNKARLYGAFVTWAEYQRDRDSKPKYPGPDDPGSEIVAASCGDSPRVAAYARAGVSRAESREPIVGSRDNTSPPAGGGGESPHWGQPEDLVALYNRLAPQELGRVEKLSDARRRKAAAYLRQFPEREFWTGVCSELGLSAFLRGLKPNPGHEHFRGDFDWLLTKGKDGTENAVKVSEGKFRDKEFS